MRSVWTVTALAAAVLLAVGPVIAQEDCPGKKGKQDCPKKGDQDCPKKGKDCDKECHGKKCDLKNVGKGKWCGKCKKILSEKEICPKKKVHPKCGEKPTEVLVCRKDFHCKKQKKKVCIESLVLFHCEGCGESSTCPKKLKHGKDCKGKKVVKKCSKSGTFPHGGKET